MPSAAYFYNFVGNHGDLNVESRFISIYQYVAEYLLLWGKRYNFVASTIL